MRISKERLKQIIKEETQKIISEAPARRTRGSLGNPTAGGNWWDPLNIAGGGTTPESAMKDLEDAALYGAEETMGALGDPFGLTDEDPDADAARAAAEAQAAALRTARSGMPTAGGALRPGTRPFRVPPRILTLGNTAFNKILNRLDDQGSIDKETWTLARRASYVMANAPEKAKEAARTKAMMILADRANIYHDSPSWETAEARATGRQPRALTAPAATAGGLSVEDFQQAIRVLRTSGPGADVIGMLPPGRIRDGYTAKFKENVRSILADYPDLEMDVVRREAQNLTNDELVPRLRQMAEKGRGLAPPPESMMAGDDAEDPLRESRRGKITKRQLQQIVKEELSAALTQKKRLNKERLLAEQGLASTFRTMTNTEPEPEPEEKREPDAARPYLSTRAGRGSKEGYSGDPEAIKMAQDRKARMSAPAGDIEAQASGVDPSNTQSAAYPGADTGPEFGQTKPESGQVSGQKKSSKKKVASSGRLTGRKINAMHRSGKFGKYLGNPMKVKKGDAYKAWLSARRSLSKGDTAKAQQIVSAATTVQGERSGTGQKVVAKSGVKQGITDRDLDILTQTKEADWNSEELSPKLKKEYDTYFSRIQQREDEKGRESSAEQISMTARKMLGRKYSLAANTAQQQKQKMMAKTGGADPKR